MFRIKEFLILSILCLCSLSHSVHAVCSIPWGGSWTNSGTCTIPAGVVDGVDNGNAILPANTSLVINGTFIFSPTTGSIRPTNPSGQITFGPNGQIRRTLAWYTDADHDSYINSAIAPILQNTSPGGNTIQKKDVSGIDCDDTTASVTSGTPVTAYRDEDGDGYGSGPALTTCGTCASLPANWSCNNTDCCDSDNRVHPGQSNYYADPPDVTCVNLASPYDYDCDGNSVKGINTYSDSVNCVTQVAENGGCASCSSSICDIQSTTAFTPECGQSFTDYASGTFCYGGTFVNCPSCIPLGGDGTLRQGTCIIQTNPANLRVTCH